MNNLVLITSIIKPPNTPLSYISVRSVFTIEERFEQTKHTIQSIREKIPGAKIFIVECSELDENELSYFTQNSDYFLNLYDDIEKRCSIHSCSKSLGEGTMTISALDFIIENNIVFDNLIKISGRYSLSENFNYSNFMNNDIVIKYIQGDMSNVFTALYKLPRYCVGNLKTFLQNNHNNMLSCVGYEVLFANFIRCQTNNIVNIDPIGLQGYVSVSNDFYSG
jgi:hypothetical protein